MDEYYIPGFTNSLMSGDQSLPTAQPVQTAAAPTGALSAAAEPAQPTASPQYKWGVLGGSADQPQYTINFRSNKRGDMPLTVSADTPIFLYDNKTKQVIASGVGFEGADAVAEAVSRMSAQGKNNWWDIYTGPAGATDPSQFKVAISDQKNTNFGQRFVGNIGTLLPIAVSFIPGFGQLSLGAKIAAGAAAGAGGAALKGQDILKGGLIGGATAGVMNAPVLGGGKTLSGVVGNTLGKVPIVGDALKEVSKITSNSPSVYDPALGGYVVSGATSATPALVSGGLSSLASSQLNNALDLARKYPGTTNYADRVYDKTLQDDFDATFGPTVYGKRLTDLASTATGLTGGIAGTVPGAGTYYKDENLVEVAGDKTKPTTENVTSGTTQTIVNDAVNDNLNPNDIVVTGDKGTRTFDDIVNGTVGTVTTSIFDQKPDAPPDGKGDDKGGPDVGDILTILGLLGGLGGTGGTRKDPSLSDFANMRGPLNPIFSAQLPAPNMQPATPRSMAGTDWYRYGYGPEQSFFGNVPQGALNTSKAYTGYDDILAPLSFASGMTPYGGPATPPSSTAAMPTNYGNTAQGTGQPAAEEESFAPLSPQYTYTPASPSVTPRPATPTAPTDLPPEIDPALRAELYDRTAKLEALNQRYMTEYGVSPEKLLKVAQGSYLADPDNPEPFSAFKPKMDEYRTELDKLFGGQTGAGFISGDPQYARRDLDQKLALAESLRNQISTPGTAPEVVKNLREMYDRQLYELGQPIEMSKKYETPVTKSHGGSIGHGGYATGGYAVGGYAVGGPGDGRDDKIPAMLSDGEYVMDAETVALLGNGSSKAGADALDKFRVNIRKHKGRKLSRGEFSVNAKKPERYLKGRK